MKKKRQNDLTLKEAIEHWIHSIRPLEIGLEKQSIISAWNEVMGPVIAQQYTRRIAFKNQILWVEISSESLKHELSFSKQKIIQNIHNHLGYEALKEVRFL